MPVTYRLLHNEDAETYRALRLQSYQEDPLAFSESFADEQTRPLTSFQEELHLLGKPEEWFVLGAFIEEHLIGFVKFRRDQRSKARHKSMVHAMYVDPTYRKRGVGKALMENLIGRARALPGLEQIHLWVLHANGKTAAHFYQNMGFQRQGPLVKDDLKWQDQYIDAEYMVLRL
ncbi:MAG: GNAT family N-acetyltransferase [Bacteroidota bacterium]